MLSSPADRFLRKLTHALAQAIGPKGWTLSLLDERDWASATLEGQRTDLLLCFTDRTAPDDLDAILSALDLDMPTHFLGDLVVHRREDGLKIKALLLKSA